MNFTFKKDIILLLSLMAFLGCATNPDNPLKGHLITEIYPAFKVFNLPFYVYYTADKFESEELPGIKKCIMNEGDIFTIIFANSSGNVKYLVVNRSGRIIGEKGFTTNSRAIERGQ